MVCACFVLIGCVAAGLPAIFISGFFPPFRKSFPFTFVSLLVDRNTYSFRSPFFFLFGDSASIESENPLRNDDGDDATSCALLRQNSCSIGPTNSNKASITYPILSHHTPR
jgi:hypothetical protein